jgi:phosphate transport system substrate-binding protein
VARPANVSKLNFSTAKPTRSPPSLLPPTTENFNYVATEPKFSYTGEYPLARYLYLTLKHNPSQQLTPLQEEVLRLVYSKDGQQLVAEEGFFPLTAQIAAEERARVGLQ